MFERKVSLFFQPVDDLKLKFKINQNVNYRATDAMQMTLPLEFSLQLHVVFRFLRVMRGRISAGRE